MDTIFDFFGFLFGSFVGISILTFFFTWSFLLMIRHSEKFSLNNRIRLNFLYKLIAYSYEIFIMFQFYQLIINSPLKQFLEYDEQGILKQFIDFFTIYQIFIFVVLNFYDSVKREIHLSLLHKIEFFQFYLDSNKSIENEIHELERHYSLGRFINDDEISLSEHKDYKEFLSYLKEYEFNRKSDTSQSEEVKFKINLLKARVSEKKERLDSLWKPSLFLRLFTSELFKKLMSYSKKI